MKYLVAVSGGVDSVVLLANLVAEGGHDLTVAHFDHGIRPDSSSDARFVEMLAASYGLNFVGTREELGSSSSEALARTRRYVFLRREAKRLSAKIVTAHHADDVIETIAINLTRGTGWRGLSVMDSDEIVRPLLGTSKDDIREHAKRLRLEWVEDSTNAEHVYLRNRVRSKLKSSMSRKQCEEVIVLWNRQRYLKRQIDKEIGHCLSMGKQSRYFFTNMDQKVAVELLRRVIVDHTNLSPTRPQVERALLSIKTAQPGSLCEVGDGVRLRFTTRMFIVETP